MENKNKWIVVCILGGFLMIIGSATGDLGLMALLVDISYKYLGVEFMTFFLIILYLFKIIALGGGISVIIGAIIIAKDHYKLGKTIIGIGAGLGLFGLIIFIMISVIMGTLIKKFVLLFLGLTGFHVIFGFSGILLTIIARRKLKTLYTA